MVILDELFARPLILDAGPMRGGLITFRQETLRADDEGSLVPLIDIPIPPSISSHVLAGSVDAQDRVRDCALASVPSRPCWSWGREKKRSRADARNIRGRR